MLVLGLVLALSSWGMTSYAAPGRVPLSSQGMLTCRGIKWTNCSSTYSIVLTIVHSTCPAIHEARHIIGLQPPNLARHRSRCRSFSGMFLWQYTESGHRFSASGYQGQYVKARLRIGLSCWLHLCFFCPSELVIILLNRCGALYPPAGSFLHYPATGICTDREAMSISVAHGLGMHLPDGHC